MLIIENPTIFCEMIQEIMLGIEGEDCKFILSENNRLLKIQECMRCIINPFSLSLNERKMVSKLHEVLKKEIQSSELLLECNEIYSMIDKFGTHLVHLSDWEIEYADKFDVQSLIKFMDIKFIENSDILIERIIQYIQVTHDLLHIRCFVFVNLLAYINKYEIEKLYEFAQYHKIYIILFESKQPQNFQYFKPAVIIDQDGCEILFNMS